MYEAYNQFTAAGEDSLCWALSTVWSHNFAIVVKLGALTYVFWKNLYLFFICQILS